MIDLDNPMAGDVEVFAEHAGHAVDAAFIEAALPIVESPVESVGADAEGHIGMVLHQAGEIGDVFLVFRDDICPVFFEVDHREGTIAFFHMKKGKIMRLGNKRRACTQACEEHKNDSGHKRQTTIRSWVWT